MSILINKSIKKLINNKKILVSKNFNKSQVQPASLDLTLSANCYRIKASFIPNNKNYYPRTNFGALFYICNSKYFFNKQYF